MCGLLTWFGIDRHLAGLEAGLSSLRHRGPDDSGTCANSFAWMGFRRLSILDLHETGHQPMKFGNGRYWLTFNGEIYNYKELRAKHLAGQALDSTGDTIVLGKMLETMPLEAVLAELRGMFSFVWYDSHEQRVFAARDHFGIKPLYYFEKPHSLGIASEVRALDEATAYSLPLDPIAVRDFFRWGAVQAPRTIIQGIQCLPPGHSMTWSSTDGLKTTRWFTPEWLPATSASHDWISETRCVVIDSIRAHMVSDVPVGVFLSSGLDSSLIACAMKEHIGSKLTAFSIGYEDDAGVEDESQHAKRTAAFLGAEFHSEVISDRSVFDQFGSYISALDQPTGDGLNTYLVSKLTAPHVKVVLSGLGADEFFSGYTYHRALVTAQAMHLRGDFALKCIYPHVDRLLHKNPLAGRLKPFQQLAKFVSIAGQPTVSGAHRSARSMMSEDSLIRLLGRAQQGHQGCMIALDDASMGSTQLVHQLLALETSSYLPNTLLRDNDCVSMAHSLELRVPFVDKEVFALSSRIPTDLMVDRYRGKKNLRLAFHEILPEWVNHEKRKKTFTLPLMKWLRSPHWQQLIQSTLHAGSTIGQYGGMQEIQKIMGAYSTSAAADKSNWLVTQRLWLLLIFEAWCSRRRERAASAPKPLP